MTRMTERSDPPRETDEVVNPEDLPSQVHVTERDGVIRIDIAEDAVTRPGDPTSADDDE